MRIQLLDFQPHGDDRGQLIALEEGKEIPFPIRRYYGAIISTNHRQCTA